MINRSCIIHESNYLPLYCMPALTLPVSLYQLLLWCIVEYIANPH